MVTQNDKSEMCNNLIFLNMYTTCTQGMFLAKVQEQKSCQAKHAAHLTILVNKELEYMLPCIQAGRIPMIFDILKRVHWVQCFAIDVLALMH